MKDQDACFSSYHELLRTVPESYQTEEAIRLRHEAFLWLGSARRNTNNALLSIAVACVQCMPSGHPIRQGPPTEWVFLMEALLRDVLEGNGFTEKEIKECLLSFDDLYRVEIRTPEQAANATLCFASKERLERILFKDATDEAWNAFIDEVIAIFAGKSFGTKECIDRLASVYRIRCGTPVRHGMPIFFINFIRWNRCHISVSSFLQEEFIQRVSEMKQ